MANRNRSTRIEDAGVLRQATFTRDGTTYLVFETRPKRTQDHFRFELRKEGESKAYVVSFQDQNGDSAACSCPAGIYHRAKGECKHVKMCRAEFMTAQVRRQAPAATRPAPRALPDAPRARALPAQEDQLALPGMDELSELTKKLNELRVNFKSKKAEVDAAEALLNTLKTELAQIEFDGNKVKEKVSTMLRNRGKAA